MTNPMHSPQYPLAASDKDRICRSASSSVVHFKYADQNKKMLSGIKKTKSWKKGTANS
jgi:hypothetical protein